MESEKMISIKLSLSSIYSMAEEAEKDDDDGVENIEEIVTYGQINYIEEDDMTWRKIEVADVEIQEQVISIFSDNTTETAETVEAVESLENADSSMRDEVSDMRKSMLDLNEIDRLMLYADDVEAEEQDREEYSLAMDTVQMKSNFLREFEFPSMLDVMHKQGSESGSTSQHKRGTRGKFVDAIDLEEPSSTTTTTPTTTSPTMSQSSAMKTTMEADNIVEASTDVSSDDDSFPDLDELRFTVPTLSGIIADDEDINLILKANAEDNEHEFDEFAEELKTAKRRNEESLAKMAQDFLYELFDSVVDQVTYFEDTENAKRNFDKDKMIRMLIELKYKYLYQMELNSLMHSKMCDYYKRTKNSRPFAILAPDVSHKLHCKHKDELVLLDHWLKVAAETKKRSAYLLSSVMMDLSYIINIVMGTEENFDNLVLKTLTTNRSETMKHIVERELRYMHQKRCELSDARLFLITRKHTLGRTVDRINKLESINEDISMNDFISNNNQVIALEKKIEERNTELKRMRHEYHVALHQTQHIHEKNLAMSAKLIECYRKLAEKERQQEILIAQIQQAKCLHTDLRKKQSELRYQGGLLCMPSLMLDFDDTVEKINTKRANIIELKNTLMNISQRVLELESQCV